MTSLRKKPERVDAPQVADSVPIAAAMLASEQLPPPAELPKSPEAIKPEDPAQEAARAEIAKHLQDDPEKIALRQRLQEMQQAERLAREQFQAQQPLPQERPEPQQGEQIPIAVQEWLTRHP